MPETMTRPFDAPISATAFFSACAEIAGEREGQGLEPLALGRERAQRGGYGLARFGLKRRGAKRHRFPLFRNAARYNRRRWL